MKSRVFNIMQYELHPVTGTILLTEDAIKSALAHKQFKQWAYIAHTEDVYSSDDEEQDFQYVQGFYRCPADKESGYLTQVNGAKEDKATLSIEEFTAKYQMKHVGQKKPKHWHIVAKSQAALDVNTVARWFEISPQYVECPKGRGAFFDCIEYLPHEGKKAIEQGKVHYDDSLIFANFDFRSALAEIVAKRDKYGRDISEKDEIRHKVLVEGLSLRELCSTTQGQLAYQDDYSTLDKLRLKYIQQYAPMPSVRINYYVCGKGGDGKSLMCRALARAIVKSLGIDTEFDDDIFFEVGAGNATFEGYDGQPVIIWNDFRAGEVLKVLGGRGNVFKVFDMHPTGRGRQNIKYGSVILINSVNIVNSVQDYSEFLDGLAGDYKKQDGSSVELAEDKGQSYRRFPFIIPLHESDFDLLMNKGVFEGTREYTQYIAYNHIRGSMKKIANRLGNSGFRRQLEDMTVRPVIEKHHELLEKVATTDMSEEEILVEFADYGKTEEQILIEQREKLCHEMEREQIKSQIEVEVSVMDEVMGFRTAKYIALGMITCGKSNKEISEESGLNEEDIEMLRHGIDYEVEKRFKEWERKKIDEKTSTD